MDPSPAPPRMAACFACGQFHALPVLNPGERVRCRRCRSVIASRRQDPLRRSLAWGIAALVFFAVAVSLPFLTMDLYGRTNRILLASGSGMLEQDGMAPLGLLIFGLVIACPGLRLAGLAYANWAAQRQHPPRTSWLLLRLTEAMRPWSMIEVYLLGLFVAYTKLADLADVRVLAAGYALGALTLLQAATEYHFDRERVWQAFERGGAVFDPARLRASLREAAGPRGRGQWLGCLQCGFVLRGPSGATCPRCAATVHARKPDAMVRTTALLIGAAILYIPANLLPILTAIELGRGAPATILGGVGQLIEAHMYPLAALVFFASITVPAIKLAGLGLIVVSTKLGSRRRIRDRLALFRVVEAIGRWSMIDMFMLSVLVGLVQLGFVATVNPGHGATAFACVVVLTMLAAMSFDPRLMWDRALEARA